MSNKRRVNLTLDGDLVDLHKIKSPIPLSTDVNNYLQESLLCIDELEEVNKQIEKCEKRLNMLRPKQARLEQQKVMKINQRNDYAALHDILTRMQEANSGVIGKNQLRGLANAQEVDFDGLLEYCIEHEFNIVEVADSDLRKYNGGFHGMI